MNVTFAEVFAELSGPSGIAPATVRSVFDAILGGQWTEVQIAAFVVALRLKGETPEQIAAAASSLRAAMIPVEHGLPRTLDTCGTGGDGSSTLNLSTGAAILAAACGVPVVKHGNRAVSSRCGSADVLGALGIATDLAPASAREVLEEVGIVFLLAPAHHPAMRYAAPVRQQLRVRTIFNVLGPLANPARATHQLLGAFDDGLRPVLAETLLALGTQRAWVVRGVDGLDEMSPYGPTRVTELDQGRCVERELSPLDFGLQPLPPGAAAGTSVEDNARVLEQVLRGDSHPARDAFVLNGAAALVVSESVPPLDATARIQEAIASGRAHAVLQAWRRASSAHRRLG